MGIYKDMIKPILQICVALMGLGAFLIGTGMIILNGISEMALLYLILGITIFNNMDIETLEEKMDNNTQG